MTILKSTQQAMAFNGFTPGERMFRNDFIHSIVSLFILVDLITFITITIDGEILMKIEGMCNVHYSMPIQNADTKKMENFL